MSSVIILIVLLALCCYNVVSHQTQFQQLTRPAKLKFNLRVPHHKPTQRKPTQHKSNQHKPNQFKSNIKNKPKNNPKYSNLRRKALETTQEPTQEPTQESNNTTRTIMVVLGCAIDYLQDDRISSALDYAANQDHQVAWFLTGGIKNAIDNTQQSEAVRMVIRIHSNQVVLDETATNTAENFANLRKYLIKQYADNTLPQIVITTSAFHKNRAEKIFNGVFMQTDNPIIHPIWNLGQQACPSCWADEHIHMRNVDNDVKNALTKYQ